MRTGSPRRRSARAKRRPFSTSCRRPTDVTFYRLHTCDPSTGTTTTTTTPRPGQNRTRVGSAIRQHDDDGAIIYALHAGPDGSSAIKPAAVECRDRTGATTSGGRTLGEGGGVGGRGGNGSSAARTCGRTVRLGEERATAAVKTSG